ncbi:cell wall-binding repeat-containing protein [Clostridium sp. DJ247]|uniref:cell wall-binding repeat-containing protein n=1 Tax=Clostridium sp. DJ247 TaxID=2726188 RepID=UPI001627F967|nr:cell wall-binding repeat-containing protein [Clostridium sp. DJ247]MBC2582048.1 cell wall-binding repeat-containing protein [Clostridium sp. DJ247]
MKTKAKRVLSTSTIASLLITSSAVSLNVKAAAVTPPESPRLWGADRYETAVKVSQAGWTSGSDYAVVASGEGFADALSAAPLAKVNNAPILLTQKGSLSASTLAELKRLNVKQVYIIGGQGVVSQAVEDTIKSQVTSNIQRLWGQDRYETAVKIAEKLGTPSRIVLASGEGYADALSAAPIAALEGIPVLLTESKTLSKATADYIKANSGITTTYVIGGYASVSDVVMNVVPNAQRFGGADRYETNAAVINAFSADFDFKNAYVALGDGPNGNEFADALSGAAIASKNVSPVIIINKVLNNTTQTLTRTHLFPSSTVTVLGGVANVPDAVVAGLKVSASFLNESGKTYSDVINGNADVTADNVTLKGNIKGDLYLSENNASVSNITVDGTIYVNPGVNGVSNLDTVTAKNIVVLSGAQDSIHLKNVKIDKLTVLSSDNVRITSKGTTSIINTVVSSQAILEATSGSFGTVRLPQTAVEKTVEFRGNFDKAVVIEGNVDIKTTSNTKLAGLVVSENAKSSRIKLEGNGTIKNIQIKNATSILNIEKNISVTGKIEAVNKNSIKSENSSIIAKIEQKNLDQMSDITSGNTSSSGSSNDNEENNSTYYYKLTVTPKSNNGTTAAAFAYESTRFTAEQIDNMTVRELYNNYIYKKDANNSIVQTLIKLIEPKLDTENKDMSQVVNAIDSSCIMNEDASQVVYAKHDDLCRLTEKKDYNGLVTYLFSKNYDELSAAIHSFIDMTVDPLKCNYFNNPIKVNGKIVTSIKITDPNNKTNALEVYNYDTDSSKGAINVGKLLTIKQDYLGTAALGDTKISDLKQKYVHVEIYLDNSTTPSYVLDGQDETYTLSSLTKIYTIKLDKVSE